MDADFTALLLVVVLVWACVAWASYHMARYWARALGPLSKEVLADIFATSMLWPVAFAIVVWDWLMRLVGGRHG